MIERHISAGTCLIVDVDGTLVQDDPALPYDERLPRADVIARVNGLHGLGVRIVIYSARNMRTHEGNLGLINLHTLPDLLSWLDRHGVCYDEVHMGKPWCGTEGFYVRVNGIRPDRFLTLPLKDIQAMLTMSSAQHGTQTDGL